MRLLRQTTNRLMRSGVVLMDEASPLAKQRAVEGIARLLAPFHFALLENASAPALVDAVKIVAEAIAATPYGEPLRFPAPLLITVGTSHFCPYSCANCYSNSGTGSASLNRHASVALFERIAASRTPCVMVSGGEPLALPHIRDLLKPLLDARKIVYLATNAPLTPIADLMANRSNNLFALLSLWGTPGMHDRQRGHGSYRRLERNFETLSQLGLLGRLLVVLNNSDLSLFDSVEALVAKYRIGTVLITRKLEVGRTDASAVTFTPDLARRIIDRTRSIKAHVRQVYLDIPEVRALAGKRTSRVRRLLGIPAHSECSAGNWMMHLDADGTAFPCYTFEGRPQVGARSGLPLSDQWNEMRRIRKLADPSALCIGEAFLREGA